MYPINCLSNVFDCGLPHNCLYCRERWNQINFGVFVPERTPARISYFLSPKDSLFCFAAFIMSVGCRYEGQMDRWWSCIVAYGYCCSELGSMKTPQNIYRAHDSLSRSCGQTINPSVSRLHHIRAWVAQCTFVYRLLNVCGCCWLIHRTDWIDSRDKIHLKRVRQQWARKSHSNCISIWSIWCSEMRNRRWFKSPYWWIHNFRIKYDFVGSSFWYRWHVLYLYLSRCRILMTRTWFVVDQVFSTGLRRIRWSSWTFSNGVDNLFWICLRIQRSAPRSLIDASELIVLFYSASIHAGDQR